MVNVSSDLQVTAAGLPEEDTLVTNRRAGEGIIPHLRSVSVSLTQISFVWCLCGIKTLSVTLLESSSVGIRCHLPQTAKG